MGKNAVKWTKLSCHDFMDNHVRLQLFALAYNLGNCLRRLVLPRPMRTWTMTTLREKVIKIGAKVVRHAWFGQPPHVASKSVNPPSADMLRHELIPTVKARLTGAFFWLALGAS